MLGSFHPAQMVPSSRSTPSPKVSPMAVFFEEVIACDCGASLKVPVAKSINVARQPSIRSEIVRGDLHTKVCPGCSARVAVDAAFTYVDPERSTLFSVLPRKWRHRWRGASEGLAEYNRIYAKRTSMDHRTCRVVFGMAELREKLIAQDAQIDDRLVELLKVLLIYEHPILIRKKRLLLVLTEVLTDELRFHAGYDHDDSRFLLTIPAPIVDAIRQNPDAMHRWVEAAHTRSIFDPQEQWISLWRWSPRPGALANLKEFADAVRDNLNVDMTSAKFLEMIPELPRGDQLPAWARKDLKVLEIYAHARGKDSIVDMLFEVRFGVQLSDDWQVNGDANDIDTLWDLLERLPDTDVEGNAKLKAITLSATGESLYWQDKKTVEIADAVLDDKERFGHVIRHEIGHAVHENHKAVVDEWLTQRFGWQVFHLDDGGINAWVNAMGGWGGLDAAGQEKVRSALRGAVGTGRAWGPPAQPQLPAGHPWLNANLGPRRAFDKTGENWFNNLADWHNSDDKIFFVNFWYPCLCVLNKETRDLVKTMPSNYAAMSDREFFAEIYAVFHHQNDEVRAILPNDVTNWVTDKFGASER